MSQNLDPMKCLNTDARSSDSWGEFNLSRASGKMDVTIQLLLLLLLVSFPSFGESFEPRLLSNTSDAYVFEGESATLTWEIESVDGYAIVWQYTVDGTIIRDHISKCISCSGEESCDIEPGLAHKYSVKKQGPNVYKLGILDSMVPTSDSKANFQAFYAQIVNCGSNDRLVLNRFISLQSARVFVYADPVCISSRVHANEVLLTCTWGPRFYAGAASQAQSTLNVSGSADISNDLILPFGVIKQIATTTSGREVDGPEARCEVELPGGMATKFCEFTINHEEHVTSVIIKPLVADVLVGQTQEMRCDIQPHSTLERRWVLCSESGKCTELTLPTATIAGEVFCNEAGECADITGPVASFAGDVRFSLNHKETLLVTPNTDISRVFIECIIETGGIGGGSLSAFASLTVMDPLPTPADGTKKSMENSGIGAYSSLQIITSLAVMYGYVFISYVCCY